MMDEEVFLPRPLAEDPGGLPEVVVEDEDLAALPLARHSGSPFMGILLEGLRVLARPFGVLASKLEACKLLGCHNEDFCNLRQASFGVVLPRLSIGFKRLRHLVAAFLGASSW